MHFGTDQILMSQNDAVKYIEWILKISKISFHFASLNWLKIDNINERNQMNMVQTRAALFGEIFSQWGHFCGLDEWIFCMCAYNENWLSDALQILHWTRTCSICLDWMCFSRLISVIHDCPQCSHMYWWPVAGSFAFSSTPSLCKRLQFIRYWMKHINRNAIVRLQFDYRVKIPFLITSSVSWAYSHGQS